MANRFLSTLEDQAPLQNPGGDQSPNRFLSSIEGIEFPEKEGFGKSFARTVVQPVLGYAKKYTWPADLLKLLSEGASKEVLAQLKEEEPGLIGETAEQARQEASNYFPTQDAAEQLIESKTGLPLTAKNKVQKVLRFAGEVGGFKQGNLKQKSFAGAVGTGSKELLLAAGVPEPIANLVGFGTGQIAPTPSISKSLKPSGMTERRFENVTKPTKVSATRHEKIQEAVEGDFRKITDKILSDKNRTYRAMKEDPHFEDKIVDLLDKTEKLSEKIPGTVSTEQVRSALRSRVNSRKMEGISPDEFEKSFRRNYKDISKRIPYYQQATAKDLLKQFRKNNASLKELFEPGKSGAANRAKREALLEYNRALEEVIHKKYGDSEFSNLFKFTNKRWMEKMDIQEVEGFLDKMFNGKIDYNKARSIFSKKDAKFSKAFRRSMGEEGFKDFKGLVDDLMTTERAMGYIKKAQAKGYGDVAKTASAFLVHPKLAGAKLAAEYGKEAWQFLLDKPKLVVQWKSALDAFKKGNYEEAQKGFNSLDKELSKNKAS